MDQVTQNGALSYSYDGFDWSDYLVFVLMLVASILIGIYFGCFGSKQKSPLDYLLGGKQMNAFPVALSMVASNISANTLIGLPTEVYTQNATFFFTIFINYIGALTAYYFVIPIFYEFNLNDPYEYLELRFDKRIRSIASFFYCFAYFLYMAVVIYMPSMTLSLVTGINEHLLTIGVTAVCVFYTMIGGLRAVIWTDFFQISAALLASIVITIIGTVDAGGISEVMQLAYDGGKLDIFNMDPSPFVRTTFWNFVGGGLISSICSFTVSQANCQRYISLKSPENLFKVLTIFCIGFAMIWMLSLYGGLLLYAAYYGCDPIKQKIILKEDHIFSLYIVDKIKVPVLPGLFVAGVFGAGLSSLSTGLNIITGIIYNDYLKTRINEKRANLTMKLTTVTIGILATGVAYIISGMGKIISASTILMSITYVPIFVLFILGMCFPSSNTKGAMAGIASCAIFLGWLSIGNILTNVNHIQVDIYANNNTCPVSNQTQSIQELTDSIAVDSDNIFPLYKLSFMLYTAYGTPVGVLVGIITSYLTGPTDSAKLDPRLISPPLRRFLPKNTEKENPVVLKNLITCKNEY